ncbi:hypothetical protein GCM10009716_17840 [Streptomyces sodiiphilus]|uniref:Uncharacterized protein n=1 Tax=Streptomyces sodiiphilus TaxID=226217 RepID=A0ABN2NZT5_9ACTN
MRDAGAAGAGQGSGVTGNGGPALVGQLVWDVDRACAARVMDVRAGRVWLRAPAGGREWESGLGRLLPCAVQPQPEPEPEPEPEPGPGPQAQPDPQQGRGDGGAR